MCDCPPEVRHAQTIVPAVALRTIAKAVVLTICDCDRRSCPVEGCTAKVAFNGDRCPNGHRS